MTTDPFRHKYTTARLKLHDERYGDASMTAEHLNYVTFSTTYDVEAKINYSAHVYGMWRMHKLNNSSLQNNY
jgi:hypothetical protein